MTHARSPIAPPRRARGLAALAGAVLLLGACGAPVGPAAAEEVPMKSTSTATAPAPLEIYSVDEGKTVPTETVVRSPEEWRRTLEPEQFRVLRQEGTERAFSGKLWDNHEHGIYRCAACGADLFTSATKFESGTGWPSFWAPVSPANVGTQTDRAFFMSRTEVHCARCGGHLGHVFTDGPAPTGLRYCMNSASLEFVPRAEEKLPPPQGIR